MSNASLQRAKDKHYDEYYTRMEDIEAEIKHYTEHLINKTVYCNADNPYESNFYKYFKEHFNDLHLKKLIATCYNENGHGLIAVYDGTETITELQGDGSYDSQECQGLLNHGGVDIIITNPPFSISRQYIPLLINSGKQFLIIGNQGIVTYKDIMPYFIQNEIYTGYEKPRFFITETGIVNLGHCLWFTNINTNKPPLTLIKQYYGYENEYPTYDNCLAINVNKTCDIPNDYFGVMGVPPSFIAWYSPSQFEILGSPHDFFVNGKKTYRRLLIKRKRET